MKFGQMMNNPSTTTTLTEADIKATVETAERRLRSLVRDVKRTCADDIKDSIDDAAKDIVDILHDWQDDDIADLGRGVTPPTHSALDKLASSKYGSFYDALKGFGLKLKADTSDDDDDDTDDKAKKPKSVLVIDGVESKLDLTDGMTTLLLQTLMKDGTHTIAIKLPEGICIPYGSANPAPAANPVIAPAAPVQSAYGQSKLEQLYATLPPDSLDVEFDLNGNPVYRVLFFGKKNKPVTRATAKKNIDNDALNVDEDDYKFYRVTWGMDKNGKWVCSPDRTAGTEKPFHC